MPTNVNGVEIPAPGSTTTYLPDPTGGWMYKVTTTVQVEQRRLDEFKQYIESVKVNILQLQSLVDEVEPQVDQAIAAQPLPVSIDVTASTAIVI